MSGMVANDNGVLGQQANGLLRNTIEQDASESSELDPLNLSELNNLTNGDLPANSTPADLKLRFGHMAPQMSNTPYQSPYLPKMTPKEPTRVANEVGMSYQGVDLTAEANQATGSISWHDPHPIFVIILIGPEEIPFGIQKDLLCAQSPYYRQEFAQGHHDKVEYLVKLPHTDIVTFGCFQNFIYTGKVYDKRGGKMVPDYPILMGVWRLATYLKMAPLRVAILDAMAERRQHTGFIPSTNLLIEAWKQTEDGSGLRKMLIEWAAEHMRASPNERSAFAQSLPQEILSSLVIVLSSMPANPTIPTDLVTPPPIKHALLNYPEEIEIDQTRPSNKRARKSAIDVVNTHDEVFEVKPTVRKPARKFEPGRRTTRRVSAPAASLVNDPSFTPEMEMDYCRDLIKRMISGPGYWTRYVSNFKRPVDAVIDNAPNYFDVVKKPMCLNMMKTKMDRGDYKNGAEFEADIRLIFQNCYEYWTPTDSIWKECEVFEDFFNNQWAQRSKYARKVKAEALE